MKNATYHMVHYREFESHRSRKLESLARDALDAVGNNGSPRWQSIEDRLMPIGDGSGLEIVTNRIADQSSAIFGEMCLINKKAVQALIELTATNKKLSTLTTAQIYGLKEQGAPKNTSYVKGIAYFLIIGNNFFFIRTQSLKPAYIEQYIIWLVEQYAKFKTPPSFESKFDRSSFNGNIGDIRALKVSGPSFPQMNLTPHNNQEKIEQKTTRKIADKFVQFGQAFGIVEALLGPTKAKSLAESLGPKERLVVDAVVRVKGTRTLESKNELNKLAKELDGITDGSINAIGKDGTIRDSDIILRTSMPFEIDPSSVSLLEFDNVADQLQEVYARFVKDGKIEA